jgi:hypothetical protein
MNFNIPKELYAHLRVAKQLAANRLLRPNFFANVAGVGIGQKVIDGVATETWCIRIYVESKLDIDDVAPAYLLPASFLDVPTDIIPVGRLGRTGPAPRSAKPPKTGPGSPIRIESSASNVNSGAIGTFGALVFDTNKKKTFILSCNHILAVNGRVKTDGTDTIVSANDAAAGQIATPGVYKKLERNQDNQVDCALALTEPYQGQPTIQKLDPPELGAKVTKTGAVTGKTLGTVVDIDADFYIDYSFGTFRFTNQVVIDGQSSGNQDDVFATDGDSGSIVFTDTDPDNMRAIAMVFAEAGRFAVACPLTKVFDQLEEEAKIPVGSLSLVVPRTNQPKETATASRSSS